MTQMNETTAKANWREIRGEVQKAWSKLSEEDLDTTNGDLKAIGSLIQKKYGEAQESSSKKLSEIFKRFDAPAVHSGDTAKPSFNKQ